MPPVACVGYGSARVGLNNDSHGNSSCTLRTIRSAVHPLAVFVSCASYIPPESICRHPSRRLLERSVTSASLSQSVRPESRARGGNVVTVNSSPQACGHLNQSRPSSPACHPVVLLRAPRLTRHVPVTHGVCGTVKLEWYQPYHPFHNRQSPDDHGVGSQPEGTSPHSNSSALLSLSTHLASISCKSVKPESTPRYALYTDCVVVSGPFLSVLIAALASPRRIRPIW